LVHRLTSSGAIFAKLKEQAEVVSNEALVKKDAETVRKLRISQRVSTRRLNLRKLEKLLRLS
jgi:hypothetical protein